jgi:uncharacterized damage-inducible protein DinB
MSELKKLLLAHTGYSAWATRELLSACAALGPEQITSRLGASHSSILGTLSHIYDGERVWLLRLRETETWRLPQDPAPEYAFDFLVQSWPELWKQYREWIEESSEAELALETRTILPDRSDLCVPRWQIILHAVNHSTLHRGQIITMLRSFGVKPPNVDTTTYFTP